MKKGEITWDEISLLRKMHLLSLSKKRPTNSYQASKIFYGHKRTSFDSITSNTHMIHKYFKDLEKKGFVKSEKKGSHGSEAFSITKEGEYFLEKTKQKISKL